MRRIQCSNTASVFWSNFFFHMRSVGPCALTSISAVTQCNSDTILVEWELTEDTPLYLVTAEGHDQTLISCNSSSNSCELQDIRCGMIYSIIVSASSDKCSSLRSPPKKIKTGIFSSPLSSDSRHYSRSTAHPYWMDKSFGSSLWITV